MQTIEFIRTSKWIVAQFEDDTLESVLRGRLAMPEMRLRGGPLLGAAINLAVSAERLLPNDAAKEILTAFGLSMLLDRQFALRFAGLAAEASGDRMGRPDRDDSSEFIHGELPQLVRALASDWRVFERSIEPFEKLTVPEAVISETDFDAVLTLELRYD